METIQRAAGEDEPISIKLAPNSTPATDAFMAEFKQRVHQMPFGRNMYALNDSSDAGHYDVLFEVSPWQGRIHLAAIMSLGKRNAGVATRAMQWMLGMADKHGVEIDGDVQPIPNTRPREGGRALNAAELKKWYLKLGFQVNRRGGLLYKPGSRAA